MSGLIFRSVIHFKFIFVYGVRQCSNLIILHATVQFSPNHLLKRLFLIVYLCLIAMNSLTIKAWVYFWALYTVPSSYVSVFVPIPYYFDYYSFVYSLKSRCDSFSSNLLSQDPFVYLGSFVFPCRL